MEDTWKIKEEAKCPKPTQYSKVLVAECILELLMFRQSWIIHCSLQEKKIIGVINWLIKEYITLWASSVSVENDRYKRNGTPRHPSLSVSVSSRSVRAVLCWEMSVWWPVSMWPTDRKLLLRQWRQINQRWCTSRTELSLPHHIYMTAGVVAQVSYDCILCAGVYSSAAGRCLAKQMFALWRQQEEAYRDKPHLSEWVSKVESGDSDHIIFLILT